MYKNIRICISTYLKYFHTFNHNTFSYDTILNGSEPFSLNGEFHWWRKQIYKLARAVISYGTRSTFVNRPSVLSSRKIRCCCLRKHTSCHDLHFFLGYSKRIPPRSLLKKSMNWNNCTPVLPNSTDQLTLDPVRENQAYCYLAEAPGGRVYNTQECWNQER